MLGTAAERDIEASSRHRRIPQRSGSASLVVVQVTRVTLKKPVAVQRGRLPRRNFQGGHFLKNARLPPLGMAPALMQGGGPPVLSYSADCRRGAQKCGVLSSCCLLTIRSALEPDRPFRVAEFELGFK